MPDFAGWRRERLPQMPDVPYLELAPDWVCEILSPSTAGFDRVRKMPIYLREQVSFVWLIDPASRTLECFRREGTSWVLAAQHVGEETARIPPFDARELALPTLWLGGASPQP